MKNIKIIGADSETCGGKPFCFQFYSDQVILDNIIWVNEKTATRKFLHFCNELDDGEYAMFVHNFQYDMLSFFYDRHVVFTSGEFSFEAHGWLVQGVYDRPGFATLTKGDKTIYLLEEDKNEM